MGKHNSNRNQYLNILYYYEKEYFCFVFFLLLIIRSVRFIHLYKYKHSSCFWLQSVLNLWFLSHLPTPMQGSFPKKPLDVPVGLLQRLDYSIVAESPPVNPTWFPLDLRNMVCSEVGAACSYISLVFFVVTIKKNWYNFMRHMGVGLYLFYSICVNKGLELKIYQRYIIVLPTSRPLSHTLFVP